MGADRAADQIVGYAAHLPLAGFVAFSVLVKVWMPTCRRLRWIEERGSENRPADH